MNVLDKYMAWTVDLIKQDVQSNTLPYACMMSHVEGDFNISTAIRNANAFGCREFFYYGKKGWDRRGSVGVQNYSLISHLSSFDEIKALKEKYKFIAIECNIERDCKNINDYIIKENSLFIFGEEARGISSELLDICDEFVYIPMIGSVRSLNVGTASGIVMAKAMNALQQTN